MAWWIVIILLALFAVYLYFQNHWIETTTYRLHLPKMSHHLRHKEIVFLTDIHIKDRTKESFLLKIVDEVKNQKPDLILLGGDIAHAQTNDRALDQLDYFLKKLTEISPVVAIFGNHELGNGRLDQIESIYQKNNVRLLKNEELLVDLNVHAPSIEITDEKEEDKGQSELAHRVNLDDNDLSQNDLESISENIENELTAKQSNDKKANLLIWGLSEKEQTFIIKRKPLTRLDVSEEQNCPVILLAHFPQFFENYLNDEDLVPDLVLAGHNHGGQVILPVIGGLYGPRQGFNPKYDYGLYTSSKNPLTRMIVSRGIGNSDFPFRFNNRPEIVRIVFG